MREFTGQQTRQAIDTEQAYAAYRAVRDEIARRFTGSMSWKTVRGQRYLYRKTNGDWKSLGPMSETTKFAHDRFHEGRAAAKARLASLDGQLKVMAPVNRALGLGRVPVTAAKVLRRLDRNGVLGSRLRVAGTHAMFAYERMGGVHFASDTVATQDVDLLFDARSDLRLAGDIGNLGLLGVLQRVDRSFKLLGKNSFRAANDAGFMIDLITPSVRRPATRRFSGLVGDSAEDLVAAEIDGLTWLESSPAVECVAIDERGFPARLVAPDPRAFACHKLWLSRRDDRDPAKRRRDRAQAETVIRMLGTHLPHLAFDDPVLEAIPLGVRRLGIELRAAHPSVTHDEDDWEG